MTQEDPAKRPNMDEVVRLVPLGLTTHLAPPSALTPIRALSFSFLSAHEGSLADQIAPDQSRWADWTDGLNMLRRDGGHVSSKETAGFVQALMEISLKIKLLGQFVW
ncbi:hypothetical protein B0H14DRAFT_3497127 [Mycena olivaceomarginata]|nr:hypothetical protein B0H14DRAFT_3497127 [Mycena olivaceomarginata]